MKFDCTKIAVGDIVTFRCGGEVEVRSVWPSKRFPENVSIQLENFHAGDLTWDYDASGECGEGTGEDRACPFDILKIERQPMIMTK